MCNGSGACRLYGAGAQCAAATCTGSTVTPARTCNGTGICQTATSSSCAPFACGTGACRTTCTTSADCASPNVCNTGSCGLKSVGTACAGDGECNSGSCAQGVCCTGPCTGNCRSCAIAGTAGTCVNVPSGQDPLNQCTDAGVATCGADGTCDGGGGCRLYAAGTTCVAATCTGSTVTPARTCNGTGTCQAALVQLHAVRLRHGRLPDDVHRRRRLPGAQHLLRGRVHQAPERRHLHRGR